MKTISEQKKIIKHFYGIQSLTDEEFEAEIERLKRKHKDGSIDAFDLDLYNNLQLEN